jgi:hypothetical protein
VRNIRVLEAERMTLRWFVDADAPFVLELLNDPAWLANLGDRNVRTLSQTTVDGTFASRSSRYRKAGTLDGSPFEGGGHKHFQLVRTARGWKIAALAWADGDGNAHSDIPT